MKKIVYNEFTNTTTTNLGAKILPTNLNDCLKKASYFVATNLNDFCHSEFCNNIGIIYNNNIKDSNILYKDVDYTNNVTKILCAMKKKAQHELVDIHFFPIKYKNNNENKEFAYLEYNMRKALVSMMVNFENWKWLVNAEHCVFEIERCDVEKTLWFVANCMSDNREIKAKVVDIVLNVYDSVDLGEWARDNYRNFEKIVDMIGDMDDYIVDRINFDKMDNNKMVRISVYGEKDYGWREIVHKSGEMCLYFTPTIKKALKRINKSMSGQKFHKYVNELLGKWFDLDEKKAWDCFRVNMSRTKDDLEEIYDANVCKIMVEQYVNNMARYYDGEMVNVEDVSNEAIVKEEIEIPVENNVVFVRETLEEAQKALEEKRKNEWKDIEIPDVNDPDFWSKL